MSRQIALVEYDSVLGQHAPIFVEERFLTVMIHLALDVFDHAILVAIRHREGTVTVLPAFKTREIGLGFSQWLLPALIS